MMANLSWFTCERRNWLVLVAAAAVAGFGFGNGHTTQSSINHLSMQLGTVKSVASCEHKRAEATQKLALQPTLVDESQLPQDCH